MNQLHESISPIPKNIQLWVFYQSEILKAYSERVIHGFSGKPITLGGLSFTSEELQENRKSLCHRMGFHGDSLVTVRQNHTDAFRLNEEPYEGEADAIILTQHLLPAMVQVADCVPIILYEPIQHVGAVIHAGWRGTAQSISKKVAQTLIERHGASAERLIAVIGPSIGGCCYEVTTEVAMAVSASLRKEEPEMATVIRPTEDEEKKYIDLKRMNALQLKTLGISQIEILDLCTRCLPDKLWSHRRGDKGRQAAFLELL